jgi:hypothetical protein
MKIRTRFIVIPASILLLLSCREVYYPDDISSGKSIPVIQGQILEDESPTVVLSWALNYNNTVPQYIHGAEVDVADDLGNRASLTEGLPGHYVSATGDLIGKYGRTYTLHVKTAEGVEFVSTPEKIHSKPVLDSLYAITGIRTTYSYNSNNQLVTNKQDGLFILSALSASADSTQFYRFNTDVLKEATYIKNLSTPSATPVFTWVTTKMDDIYTVAYSIETGNRQVLPEHQVGFLWYLYDPHMVTRTTSAPVTIGWVVTFRVYSVSRGVFDYYQSIADQLNAADELFVPVPSQVKSNIRCISNTGQPVIGVFEAASSVICYKAFRWRDKDPYQSVVLDTFPTDVPNGSTSSFPPSFWINFN